MGEPQVIARITAEDLGLALIVAVGTAERLGHRTVAETMNGYVHASPGSPGWLLGRVMAGDDPADIVRDVPAIRRVAAAARSVEWDGDHG